MLIENIENILNFFPRMMNRKTIISLEVGMFVRIKLWKIVENIYDREKRRPYANINSKQTEKVQFT